MSAENLVIIAILLLIVVVVFFAVRKPPAAPPKATPPKDEPKAKTHALEKRIEVDAPVEISEDMSLAEIKRAKAARIRGDKGRRQTAVEATEQAEEEYGTVEVDAADGVPTDEGVTADEVAPADDVDAGWDDLDDDVAPVAASPPVEPAAVEPAAVEPAAVEPAAVEPAAVEPAAVEPATVEPVDALPAADEDVEEPLGLEQMSESFGTPLAEGLARTRTGFIQKLGQLFRREELDEALVEDLEEVLYTADIGTKAATAILGAVEEHLSKDEKKDPDAVWKFVRGYVEELLTRRDAKLDLDAHNPFVILVIGVNGVGKTTTIGKMAAKFKRSGKKVLLVAGDTFRAAAVEQIEVWGKRAQIPVHTGGDNADPASVVFSGVQRGRDEGFDVIICDTAGRLHTKAPLLDELEKINRVTQKVIPTAPHETILVLDANTGQNAIQQAKIFQEAVPITGIVLTKLDGTAKGGVILGICDELDVPIRYIGIGESVADLRQFDAREFTEALFM